MKTYAEHFCMAQPLPILQLRNNRKMTPGLSVLLSTHVKCEQWQSSWQIRGRLNNENKTLSACFLTNTK